MKNSLPQKNIDAKMILIIEALAQLRDSLVRAKLIMEDIQFKIETGKNSASAEQTKEILDKIKGR